VSVLRDYRSGTYDDDSWHVDPIPRVIPGDEWERIAAGLAQRVRALDVAPAALPRSIDGIGDALHRVLGDGNVVVLTDGPDNSAFWKHEWIAERLRVALVRPGDLRVREGRIHHDDTIVDTIYRRPNDDEVDSEVGRLLHPVVAAGGVRLINCFGTGVGDDKLAHAYVPDMIRFYLDEEPLLPQVETFDIGEPRTLERALDVEDLREKVRAAPQDYVAQRLVGLSTHPTEVHGRLAPRHVDLRPFVLMSALDEIEVLPGGITRVALDEGALVVNSSQNGGAKDTWVV
jgi:uncharacterized circularly permuted ATP-grasp superfamily protein